MSKFKEGDLIKRKICEPNLINQFKIIKFEDKNYHCLRIDESYNHSYDVRITRSLIETEDLEAEFELDIIGMKKKTFDEEIKKITNT